MKLNISEVRENKTLAKWRNHSIVYQYREIMPLLRIFKVANMSFKAFRKNKIIAKISELTVTNGLPVLLNMAATSSGHFLSLFCNVVSAPA